ncbi:MAG: hypothetical protein LH632_20335 [Rhodoferax sp.]|nr:hypothetical protein [Rhodoferax sp.]
MRFRLLRRRLTISAPRMAVRSTLPWPFRWIFAAVVLGFCAAIGLWAFEFGKVIAGLDGGAQEEVTRLRAELLKLKAERDQAQVVANTAQTLLTTEKAAQEQLLAQKKQLEADNLGLRDDLGFFDKLIPSTGVEGIAIRGLEAEVQDDRRLRWRILLIQPQKNAGEFKGTLDITVTGVLGGKPWTLLPVTAAPAVKFSQFGRFQGVLELPPQAVVMSVTVKVLDGSVVKATQALKL